MGQKTGDLSLRPELVQQLRTLVIEQGRPVLLLGVAGIGKSELVRTFARQFASTFSGTHWVLHSEVLGWDVSGLVDDVSGVKLVVIENAEILDQQSLSAFIRALRVTDEVRLIVISRLSRALPDDFFRLVVPQLPRRMAIKLLMEEADRVGRVVTQSEAESLVSVLDGHPLAIRLAARALIGQTVAELLARFNEIASGLYDIEGRELPSIDANDGAAQLSETGIAIPTPDEVAAIQEGAPLINVIVQSNQQLLKRIADDPRLLYEVSSRQFEEIVAELLRHRGFDVRLTAASRDGGKDIYAAANDGLGSFLYIVECKKYGPDQKVGVGVVRQLYGVVEAEQATAGIIVTTAYFTSVAKAFEERLAYRVSLKDYSA